MVDYILTWSHCRFVLLLIHFIPDLLTYCDVAREVFFFNFFSEKSTHQFSSLLLDCELSWHRKVSSRLAAFLLDFAFAFSLASRAAPPLRARKRRTMSPSDMGGWVVVLAFFFGRLF
jgi:hypothetical protein